MQILLIDAHPDEGRYCSHLLNIYQSALPGHCDVKRVALRDLNYALNLKHGYNKRTEWEPDLLQTAQKLDACDHVVFAFPMWWGAEPAELKGLLDRLFLPGFSFAYHENDTWWDKLMMGRSADVIITMDTPPWYHRIAHGNAVVHRWKKQILSFAGFKPVRILPLGQVKFGGGAKHTAKWAGKVEQLARTAGPAKPDAKELRLERFLNPAKS